MLSTQNPVDLDYKALPHAGTWFLGRLQTEHDNARVLDGVEGVASGAGQGFDRQGLDTLFSGLDKRVFLLHNVHDSESILLQSRWSAPTPVAAAPSVAAPTPHPIVPPDVPQYFAPGHGASWVPMLVGAARVWYTDSKLGLDDTSDVVMWTPLTDGPVAADWEHAEPASFAVAGVRPRVRAAEPEPSARGQPRRQTTPALVVHCEFDVPAWRNWQTRGTQNPVPPKGVWVRFPPPAPP